MHEMTLTRDIVDTVVAYANNAGATKVSEVRLTIGEARDIVDDLFEKCFAFMARGTVAEGAELVIVRIPVTVRCKDCDFIYHVETYHRQEPVRCPYCGSDSYSVNSGGEFTLDSIVLDEVHADKPAMAFA